MDNNTTKPKDISEYKEWLREEHDYELTPEIESYYSTVMRKIKADFENTEVWRRLIEELREYNDEYVISTGYQLLAGYEVELYIKPWQSFVLKTYRKNILNNDSWPDPPQGGWILPDSWLSRVNDPVRTLLVVKYLDGVEFVVNKVKAHFESYGTTCNASFEARSTGYYAAHLHTRQSFEVPKMTWDTQQIDVWVEMQVTTQLQEVIRRLTHRHYEQRRVVAEENDTNWQWNYRSDEFAANYLGHILHYYDEMCTEEIIDVFISEYLTEEGLREYENLWFFSKTFAMEAKTFLLMDDFDLMRVRDIGRLEFKGENYNYKNATIKSRLNVEVSLHLGTPFYMRLRASQENCDYLMTIVREYIAPNIT